MSTFIDNTEKEYDNQVIKKMKVDTDTPEQPEQPSNPFMGLSLINPDEIEENLLLYKPKHKVGEKFIMNDTEFTIRQIIMDYDKNKEIQLYKYVFVPSRGQSYHNYKDIAYDIDRMIDMKEMRERKGQPLGGKHKSRRRRRHRKSRKSKKSRKSRKSRK
jgi:hypothetical protein